MVSPHVAQDIKRRLVCIYSLGSFLSAIRSIFTLVCPLPSSCSSTPAFCKMLASLLVALALPVLIDAVPLQPQSPSLDAVGVNVG
jgi:hypothetical protein